MDTRMAITSSAVGPGTRRLCSRPTGLNSGGILNRAATMPIVQVYRLAPALFTSASQLSCECLFSLPQGALKIKGLYGLNQG